MAKNKKKVKEEKYSSEESNEIYRFLIVLGIILLIIAVIYLTAVLVENKRNTNNTANNDPVAAEIDYDVTSVGTILNRPYDNYYVIVYNSEDTEAFLYSSLMASYKKVGDSKKIYLCDLSNPFNSSFASEKSNPSATKVDEFAFGKITLLEISKGKITRYVESLDQIKEILK